jgi:flavin-binding protein dodecin
MRRIMLASVTLALAACASTPGYAPASSPNAAGYSEQMIAKDRWRVRYTGASKTSAADAHDYALMRAAQLTLEHGATWFEVVDGDADVHSKNRYSIETGLAPDYAVQQSCGLFGCTTRAVPVMMRTQYQTVETRTFHAYSLEILMGSGEHFATASTIYDARDTFTTLKDRLD